MRRATFPAILLVLTGCGLGAKPAAEPPAPVHRPAPASPEVAHAPAPHAPKPATPSDHPTARLADSAAKARDSALDAAVLAELEAGPPAGLESVPVAPLEDEAVALRELFDIDVANFADHARVKYYLDFFTTKGRERMGIWLERMPRWEPLIRTQLTAKGLPGDLAYLPLIESGYSNTAVSRSRAVGMWQFMRGTARFYGLRVDKWVDERREPFRATTQAVRYLGDLTARFGSPYLAAAAYNGGPGRVQRGLNRLDIELDDEEDEEDAETVEGTEAASDTIPQAGDAAFFQLASSRYIHRETKDYVPKLIAAAMIAKRPDRYGFRPIPAVQPLQIDSVTVPDATGLDVVARSAGVELAALRELNPHYLRSITPPRRKSVVMVPEGTGAEAQRLLDAMPASERITAITHRVRSGETATRIAKRYGLTVAELRTFNPAIAKRAPRAGETLRIPGHARVKSLAAADARVANVRSSTRGTHRVQRGETLSHIARRYRVTVTQLRAWNGLGSSSRIRAGQVLRLRPRSRPSVSTRVAR
ncbi:MAG: LysM peptidoglycan-binding domain-containing protein [Gemmatimonadales bacterium]